MAVTTEIVSHSAREMDTLTIMIDITTVMTQTTQKTTRRAGTM